MANQAPKTGRSVVDTIAYLLFGGIMGWFVITNRFNETLHERIFWGGIAVLAIVSGIGGFIEAMRRPKWFDYLLNGVAIATIVTITYAGFFMH